MRRAMMVWATGLALSMAGAAQAQEMESQGSAPSPNALSKRLGLDPEQVPALNPEQHDLARVIGRDVVCLCGTCPKEPVTDCTCGWAAANRRAIEQAVARGMTREQIVGAYREAYGERGLAMIPKDGFAQMAWILPYAAGLLGLAAVLAFGLRLRRRTEARAEAPLPPPQARDDARADLARQLDELDG